MVQALVAVNQIGKAYRIKLFVKRFERIPQHTAQRTVWGKRAVIVIGVETLGKGQTSF